MAKTRVSEKVLKKELHRLGEAIIEQLSSDDEKEFAENGFSEYVDRAIQILHGTYSSSTDQSCPRKFNCPLSKDMMSDPVIVSTGKTYDRSSIQEWLAQGNTTCPITQQPLWDTSVIPNHLVRDMISQWCKNRGIPYPIRDPSSEEHAVLMNFKKLVNSWCSKRT